MESNVKKLLDVALAEEGYLEKSSSAWKQYGVKCLYEKTKYAGYDNYTKYGYEMHQYDPSIMDFPAYWCDTFVDWCFSVAFGVETAKKMIGGFDDYTKGSISRYKKLGRFHYNLPKEGDQIFFSKDGTANGVYHTGIVYAVDQGRVYTIEGNTSGGEDVDPNGGGVFKKSYSLVDTKIYGYGRPNYNLVDWHWVSEDHDWYYQDAEGNNAHGWKLIAESDNEKNKHWYYFDSTGRMITGLRLIDGEHYYLTEAGPLIGACCTTNEKGQLKVWYVED